MGPMLYRIACGCRPGECESQRPELICKERKKEHRLSVPIEVYKLTPEQEKQLAAIAWKDPRRMQDLVGGYKQSRGMSAVETVASTAIGLTINTVANYLVLPLWGLHPTIGDSIALAVVFTGLSVARGFALRRLFEAVRVRWGNWF